MLIILLVAAYLMIRVFEVLDSLKENTENGLESQIKFNKSINQHVYTSPTTKPSTIDLKEKILKIVNDHSIPAMKKPDILVNLLIELREHEDTSEFMDTFPEIHMYIFRRSIYEYD